MSCLACGHDRDRHGPEAGGCIECRCSDTFVRRVPLTSFPVVDQLGLNDDEDERGFFTYDEHGRRVTE